MDVFIFIVALLSFLFLTVTLFGNTTKKENNFFQKNNKKLFIVSTVCEVILAVISILDISGILDLSGYTYMPIFCTVFGAISLISFKISLKGRNFLSFAARSAMICAIAEIFIFNFNSAHLFGQDYQTMILSPEKATTENIDIATGQNIDFGHTSLEFKDINIPVGTITIEAESDTAPKFNVSIDMSDDTNSGYRYSIASAEIIMDNERSQTIPCNFSGNVHDLKFSYDTTDGQTVTLKNIILNVPIFFEFSILRFAIMLLASFAVYMMVISVTFKKPLYECKTLSKVCSYTLTGVFILTALFLSNAYRYTDPEHSLKKDFEMESGNQITQEIVDAFEAGQTSLLQEVEPKLLELENPYDWSQRTDAQISYAWDHLLYDGKYYSYYGIAPLLLFLPYHMITDYYFPSVWAIWLFGAVGIFFLTKFYMCFMNKFFSKTRTSIIIMGLFIMQLVTGIWFCFSTPNFYEIAQSSGFACVTAGAFFLISSNVIGDGKIKNWRLALSTVCLSLGVLCRPTLAIYCVAALLFIFAGFMKKKKEYSEGNSKLKYYAPYFICAMLPFVIIGGIQMIYNYMRFGSIFDFGIQYSLTINDFTAAQYHTHFVLIGFFNYLFAIPSFTPTFPFMDTSAVHTFMPQGYYFVATASAIGLLWKAFPIVSYGYGLKAYRLNNNKNKNLYTILLLATCVAAPFIIIFSIWESGYGTRYCVDFAWQILLGALVIAFMMYEKCSIGMRNHLNKLMLYSSGICLILNFGQVYNWVLNGSLSTEWKAMFYSFGRMFEFWR